MNKVTRKIKLVTISAALLFALALPIFTGASLTGVKGYNTVSKECAIDPPVGKAVRKLIDPPIGKSLAIDPPVGKVNSIDPPVGKA